MSIKNIVFDFGQVLIKFDPAYMVSKYTPNEDDAKLLCDVLFDRLYWDKLDSGDISDAEVVAHCKQRLPERLWDAAESAYYNWIYNIPEIDGMRELTLYLKSRGIRLFLLSNISTYFAEHIDEFSILEPFERCVLSAPIKMVKPNADIFEYLCSSCDILASETLFIDDNALNVKGAQAVGISAYQFDGDVEKLKIYLNALLNQ